ncbi:MAG TPA: tRNA pseudouridine(55) synthase TruB [Acidobacteriota bacterium]|nr:tRNA pseudouridine(55) synthase TruB [Acidobacteriota bacterium]
MSQDGLLIIDKPAGPTSHDVVQHVRKALAMRRVGHGGTLDPDATGVLLVAAGQATRFFPFLSKEDKVYEGRIRLGVATDTYDASGRPVSAISPDLPGPRELAAAMKDFEGGILQTPPRFSAKKIAGRPVYKMARAEEEFALEPVRITIYRFHLRDYRPPDLDFEAACSAGTYIRSLAHDLGVRLGCGAHLARLRRTSVGPYGLADAVPLADFENAAARGEGARFILPLERLLPWAPAVTVRPEAEAYVRNGRSLEPSDLETAFPDFGRPEAREAVARLVSPGGKLIALARPTPDGSSLHPFLVIA